MVCVFSILKCVKWYIFHWSIAKNMEVAQISLSFMTGLFSLAFFFQGGYRPNVIEVNCVTKNPSLYNTKETRRIVGKANLSEVDKNVTKTKVNKLTIYKTPFNCNLLMKTSIVD